MFHHVLNQGILSLINLAAVNSAKMEDNQELVFASFNQDTTSLAVGTTNGYKLYSLTSTDSLEPIYSNGEFKLNFFLLTTDAHNTFVSYDKFLSHESFQKNFLHVNKELKLSIYYLLLKKEKYTVIYFAHVTFTSISFSHHFSRRN